MEPFIPWWLENRVRVYSIHVVPVLVAELALARFHVPVACMHVWMRLNTSADLFSMYGSAWMIS